MIEWRCQQCGDCCRNLGEEIAGVPAGMLLLPPETDLFPQGLVKPYWGKVGKPFGYQMVAQVCPHLREDNSCAVYLMRPFICRAFPLETASGLVVISPRCRNLQGVPEARLPDVRFTEEMFRAMDFIHQYLLATRPDAIYDFRRGIWITHERLSRLLRKALTPLANKVAAAAKTKRV